MNDQFAIFAIVPWQFEIRFAATVPMYYQHLMTSEIPRKSPVQVGDCAVLPAKAE